MKCSRTCFRRTCRNTLSFLHLHRGRAGLCVSHRGGGSKWSRSAMKCSKTCFRSTCNSSLPCFLLLLDRLSILPERPAIFPVSKGDAKFATAVNLREMLLSTLVTQSQHDQFLHRVVNILAAWFHGECVCDTSKFRQLNPFFVHGKHGKLGKFVGLLL